MNLPKTRFTDGPLTNEQEILGPIHSTRDTVRGTMTRGRENNEYGRNTQ